MWRLDPFIRSAQQLGQRQCKRTEETGRFRRDGKWINSCLNMDETAMRYNMTRLYTVAASGARVVQMAHDGENRVCLALIVWVTPGVERGRPMHCDGRVSVSRRDYDANRVREGDQLGETHHLPPGLRLGPQGPPAVASPAS
jgi:hypothetical protein